MNREIEPSQQPSEPERQPQPISIRAIDVEELIQNLDIISARIAAIAADGFGPGKAMSPERIARRLMREPYVILAEEGSNLVAFQFQSVHETETQKYLYYSRVVKKNQQGKGIAQSLLNKAIATYEPSVIGARSQNPAEILSFIKAIRKGGRESVYPFISSQEKVALLEMVTEFLEKIGFSGKVDLMTGLGRRSYEEGRLGDYDIHLDNPEIRAIEDYFTRIGLSREMGDSVFYFARLSEQKTP